MSSHPACRGLYVTISHFSLEAVGNMFSTKMRTLSVCRFAGDGGGEEGGETDAGKGSR